MTKEQIALFNSIPLARDLHYRQVQLDYRRASEFFEFMRIARFRGLMSRLCLDIDNQVASVDMSPHSDAGASLYEFLGNWVVGMALRDIAIIEEMRQIWPELPIADLGPFRNTWPVKGPEVL